MITRQEICNVTGLALLTCMMSLIAATNANAQLILPGDLVIGGDEEFDSIELARVEVDVAELQESIWDTPNVQSLEFDNLGGLSHNPQGNLLAADFGSTVEGAPQGDSAIIYSLPTCVDATTLATPHQVIGNTGGLGGAGIDPTRIAGLSVSLDNSKIAAIGFDTGRVLVYDYTAGNCRNEGAALSGGRQSSGSALLQFATQGTAWLDNDHVLSFSPLGGLVRVNANTMEASTVATLDTGQPADGNFSNFTDVEHNPALSPYVYVSYSGFDRDNSISTNSLFILDPRDNFSLTKRVDLDAETVESLREIAFGPDGSLFLGQFRSGGVDILPNANNPASLTDNSSLDFYLPFDQSTFSGMDVAVGLPFPDMMLEGDFNDDGALTAADIDALSEAARGGAHPTEFDLTGDGLVNEADRSRWIGELKDVFVGDSDFNGEFNSDDLLNVFSNGEYVDDIDGNSTWEEGDWDGNGDFDSDDLLAAFADGGYEVGPRATAVPEPATWSLVCLGALSLLHRRRRS